MVYPLNYQRPAYVSDVGLPSTLSSTNDPSSRLDSLQSANSSVSTGIPEALSFDRIINGGTCSVSLHVFLLMTMGLSMKLGH